MIKKNPEKTDKPNDETGKWQTNTKKTLNGIKMEILNVSKVEKKTICRCKNEYCCHLVTPPRVSAV